MTLVVDGVMVLVVLEGIVLAVLGRVAILPNLFAGLMLLLAMRLALGGFSLPLIGAALLVAGIAHAIDLKLRL